ncbi:hypothetical protein MKW92_004730 [Papaver armeniacum]|nr:hypothetical protein MKW92_004730 [Papaver armeniacum]
MQLLGDPMSRSCTHDNTEIYEKAVKILETYWLEKEDEMPPLGDAAQTEFHCGGTQPQLPSDGFYFGRRYAHRTTILYFYMDGRRGKYYIE